ncbi:MAG: hypothetical protein HY606_08090 [Planctomycetes bacterium]|nr:hypothetical protein [Planctomycetota bacterium]
MKEPSIVKAQRHSSNTVVMCIALYKCLKVSFFENLVSFPNNALEINIPGSKKAEPMINPK